MLENKVVACTVIKDCPNRLRHTIESWQNQSFIQNIIVVDWSSKIPIILHPKLKNKFSQKTYIIEAVYRPDFELSLAKNIAVQFVNNYILPTIEYILIIDSDVLIKKEFPDEWFDTKLFIKGKRHTKGTILFPIKRFLEVGGYDRHLNFGEGGDRNIIRKLKKHGLNNFCFNTDFIKHMGHKSGKWRRFDKEKSPNALDDKIKTIVYCPDGKILNIEW